MNLSSRDSPAEKINTSTFTIERILVPGKIYVRLLSDSHSDKKNFGADQNRVSKEINSLQIIQLGNTMFTIDECIEHGNSLEYKLQYSATLKLHKTYVSKSEYYGVTGFDPLPTQTDPAIAVRYDFRCYGDETNNVGFVNPHWITIFPAIGCNSAELDKIHYLFRN